MRLLRARRHPCWRPPPRRNLGPERPPTGRQNRRLVEPVERQPALHPRAFYRRSHRDRRRLDQNLRRVIDRRDLHPLDRHRRSLASHPYRLRRPFHPAPCVRGRLASPLTTLVLASALPDRSPRRGPSCQSSTARGDPSEAHWVRGCHCRWHPVSSVFPRDRNRLPRAGHHHRRVGHRRLLHPGIALSRRLLPIKRGQRQRAVVGSKLKQRQKFWLYWTASRAP